jgi:hypothetical protein
MKKLTFFVFAALAVSFLMFAQSAWAASVTLAWNKNIEPEVTGYKIYYGTTSKTYPNIVDAGNNTVKEISGLVEGVKYYFAAIAYAASGESDFSEEVSFIPTASIGGTFDEISDITNWNNGVYYVGGGATASFAQSSEFTSGGALKVSGGNFQAIRRTFFGPDLQIGETVVATGRLKVVSFKVPGEVHLRGNGTNQKNWTESVFEANGKSQLFALPIKITSLDLNGLDINVFILDSLANVYIDDIQLWRGSDCLASLLDSPNLAFVTEFSSVAGWDNNVHYVYGGNSIMSVSNVDGPYHLKVYGGSNQGARKVIPGLVAGSRVAFSGEFDTSINCEVDVRTNGTNRTNWTQATYAHTAGSWQSFYLEANVTTLDVSGMDFNVFAKSSGRILRVRNVRISVLGAEEPETIYTTDFSVVSDWDNKVNYVFGDATLVKEGSSGTAAIAYNGVSHQGIRKMFTGLSLGARVYFSANVMLEGGSAFSVRSNGTNQTNWTQKTYQATGQFQEVSLSALITSKDTNGFDFNIFATNSPGAVIYVKNFKMYVQKDEWENNPYYVDGNSLLSLVKDPAYGGYGFALKFSKGTVQGGKIIIYGIPPNLSLRAQYWFQRAGSMPIHFRTSSVGKTNWTEAEYNAGAGIEGYTLEFLTDADSCRKGLEIAIFALEPSPAEIVLTHLGLYMDL